MAFTRWCRSSYRPRARMRSASSRACWPPFTSPQFLPDRAEIMPGARQFGIEFDGLLVVAAGLVDFSQLLVGHAGIEPDHGLFRREGERLFVGANGLGILAVFVAMEGHFVPSEGRQFGFAGRRGGHFANFERFLEAVGSRQHHAR